MSFFGDMSYSWPDIDIFYSLATTPKSAHRKHPSRKFNKHLIVKLGMCEKTYIGAWSFSGISSRIQPLFVMETLLLFCTLVLLIYYNIQESSTKTSYKKI